jgi:hypothetical protein
MKQIVGLVALFLAACGNDSSESPPPLPVASYTNHHESLSTGELFVPADYAPLSEIDVVVHFHGANGVTEEQFILPAALVTVNFNGLSSAYSGPFSDPSLLETILDEAVAKAGLARGIENPVFGRVVLSSFSAGYGAIREILLAANYDVYGVVLADSLHAGYYNAQPNPWQMEPFVDFAKKAASGTGSMTLSHSAIMPGSYASTTETADLLIADTSATRISVDLWNPLGMHQVSEAVTGNFRVRGFAGQTGADHMDHLYYLGELWKDLTFP